MRPLIDIAGQRFGRLVAVELSRRTRKGALWICACDCGKEQVSYGQHLRLGLTRSCGCLLGTHRQSKTRLYRVWAAMRRRCSDATDPGFMNYGGRGISVCRRWQESFEAFIVDMGPRPSDDHSIDRINNDGNYEPENCRWATSAEQIANRRNTRRITISGRSMTYKEAAQTCGLSVGAVRHRDEAGWSGEEIASIPRLPRNKRRTGRKEAGNAERIATSP